MRRTPRDSTAGNQGRQMLAHKRGQTEARKGVRAGAGGGSSARTGAGGRVGTADRGPPRASAKLPEAASGMRKQEEGSERTRRRLPRGAARVSGALPRLRPAKAALVGAAHGRHRLAPGGLCRYGPPGRGVSTELQPPAAFPRLPLGPRPPESETTLDPRHPRPRNQAVSAGSSWPCVPPPGPEPQHTGVPAQETPRAVGPPRPPRAGRSRGPAVHLLGRRLLAAGQGGCNVLPVADSGQEGGCECRGGSAPPACPGSRPPRGGKHHCGQNRGTLAQRGRRAVFS